MSHDPLALAQKLIQFPSVTPVDAGVIDFLVSFLQPYNFTCKKIVSEDVTNLYARIGSEDPVICFAGHTDVVPAGDNWSVDPFAAIVEAGLLYGRGAVDMKAAIAAFISASIEFKQNNFFKGSIVFLISGNEEGVADNGTPKLLEYLKTNNINLDACIVGEPTCAHHLGDIIKYGRRGSISFKLTVKGKQGHVAYPQLADNPIDKLIAILAKLKELELDVGNQDFDRSNLEITNITVNNNTDNVIPSEASAAFNIRFNDLHSPKALILMVKEICAEHEVTASCSAKAFIGSKNSLLIDNLCDAIYQVTAIKPKLSTTGGTSDARFIKDHCPVIEFGLLNQTAHQVDEHASVSDINKLKEIYYKFLQKYFSIPF